MASVTGTASTINASAASGSTGVTVPADATVAVAFWGHWDNNGGSTMGTLTLDDVAFTTQSEKAEGIISGATGIGVAVLLLPATGSQTLAWQWSAGGARQEGGGLFVAYAKDVDTSSLANAVIDAKTDTQLGGNVVSVSLATEADCLPIGLWQTFGTNPLSRGHDVVLVDGAHPTATEFYDVAYSTTFTNPEVFDFSSGEDFSAIAGISLRNGTAAPPSTGGGKIIFPRWVV